MTLVKSHKHTHGDGWMVSSPVVRILHGQAGHGGHRFRFLQLDAGRLDGRHADGVRVPFQARPVRRLGFGEKVGQVKFNYWDGLTGLEGYFLHFIYVGILSYFILYFLGFL